MVIRFLKILNENINILKRNEVAPKEKKKVDKKAEININQLMNCIELTKNYQQEKIKNEKLEQSERKKVIKALEQIIENSEKNEKDSRNTRKYFQDKYNEMLFKNKEKASKKKLLNKEFKDEKNLIRESDVNLLNSMEVPKNLNKVYEYLIIFFIINHKINLKRRKKKKKLRKTKKFFLKKEQLLVIFQIIDI